MTRIQKGTAIPTCVISQNARIAKNTRSTLVVVCMSRERLTIRGRIKNDLDKCVNSLVGCEAKSACPEYYIHARNNQVACKSYSVQ